MKNTSTAGARPQRDRGGEKTYTLARHGSVLVSGASLDEVALVEPNGETGSHWTVLNNLRKFAEFRGFQRAMHGHHISTHEKLRKGREYGSSQRTAQAHTRKRL